MKELQIKINQVHADSKIISAVENHGEELRLTKAIKK